MQDTITTRPAPKLFAMDVLVMGLLMSLVGWGSLEIVANNEAIATLEEKNKAVDSAFETLAKTSNTLTKTNATLLRIELQQEFYNISINKEVTLIRRSLSLLENAKPN
tara:strand:- start:99 stop:422 length:324 start_codon:yes stop_codon:yes gene_type:complete